MKKVKTKKPQEACPKCGNKHYFNIYSRQCCKDGCEIWAECVCGYDPTDYSTRIESVWGSIGLGKIEESLNIWNKLIKEQNKENYDGKPLVLTMDELIIREIRNGRDVESWYYQVKDNKELQKEFPTLNKGGQ